MSVPQPPHRVYLIFTLDINPQNVQKLLIECASWANKGTKELYLLVASNGGNVAAGIAAYNALRSLPVKLITHNIGNIDSIATVIFLAGEERIASPHTTFMFHGVAFDLTGPLRADHTFLTNHLDSISADHAKIAAIVNERAKFNAIDDITALFTSQATKDAQYALDHGLIHKVEHHKIPAGSATLVFAA